MACETLVTTGMAMVAGEITTKAVIDYAEVVRKVIREVGYIDDEHGHFGRHLRGDALVGPAEPGHRPGRRTRTRPRARRSGPATRG